MKLVAVPVQQGDVVGQAFDLVQDHAAMDASCNGRRLVFGEVDARGPAQETKDLAHLRVGLILFAGGGFGGSGNERMAADPGQFARDLLRRQHEIDAAGGDRGWRACRHISRSAVLGESDAPFALDGG